MSLYSRFFGLEEPTEKAIKLVRILAFLEPVFAVSFMISTTFWMIYIAESLGGGDYIAGLTLVGILVIIQLVIQTMLDYPTGALGDHIGQRWVIASSLVCYAIGFWLTSIATPESPFSIFVAIYVLFGLGASQESGAWGAWFDNNYRVAMPHDKDRKMYGVFSGRMGMIFQIIATAVLLPGAWLALLYGRTWVFKVQAVTSVILAIVVLIYIRDFPEVEEIRKEQNETNGGYVAVLKDGVKFLVSDPFITLIILGEVILWASGTLWWQLMLFPLYFLYLLTDVAVSAYRTIAFVPNVIAQERSGIWSKHFDPVKWIPRFRLVQFCSMFFYFVLAANVYFFPPPEEGAEMFMVMIPFTNLPLIEMPVVSVIPLVILLIAFTIGDFFGAFADILTQRVMLDVVPNRIRNSMYSLRPTLAIICAIPMIWFFGWFIPLYGFALTFALCGVITLVGVLLVKKGFSYPIPKSEDLETLIETSEVKTIEAEILGADDIFSGELDTFIRDLEEN